MSHPTTLPMSPMTLAGMTEQYAAENAAAATVLLMSVEQSSPLNAEFYADRAVAHARRAQAFTAALFARVPR